MMVHESRKSGQVFSCQHDGCSKTFAYESTLRKHIASQHKPVNANPSSPIAERIALAELNQNKFANCQDNLVNSNEQSVDRLDCKDIEPRETNVELQQLSNEQLKVIDEDSNELVENEYRKDDDTSGRIQLTISRNSEIEMNDTDQDQNYPNEDKARYMQPNVVRQLIQLDEYDQRYAHLKKDDVEEDFEEFPSCVLPMKRAYFTGMNSDFRLMEEPSYVQKFEMICEQNNRLIQEMQNPQQEIFMNQPAVSPAAVVIKQQLGCRSNQEMPLKDGEKKADGNKMVGAFKDK